MTLAEKEEAYAQCLFDRGNLVKLYGKTHPRASHKTCLEQASRIAKNPRVVARLAELDAHKAAAQAKIYAKQAAEAGEAFKGQLLTSFRRRQLLQARAENPRISETALVAVLKLDAELAGDFKTTTELTGKDGAPLPSAVPETIVCYLPAQMARPRIPKPEK